MSPPAPPRVLVTRAEERDGPLSSLLRENGFEPVPAPAVREVPCLSPSELVDRTGGLGRAAWFVVTSPRAVRILDGLGAFDGPPPPRLRIAAAGGSTGAALANRGWEPHLVPDQAGAASLARALLKTDTGTPGTVVFPCSARARPELPRALSKAGYTVVEIPVYDMRPVPQDRTRWDGLLARGTPAVVTFTSPSCIQGLVRGLADAGLDPVLETLRAVPAAVQGPTTASAAREAGWRTPLEASPRTFPGLVDAVRALAGVTAATSDTPSPVEVDS